MFGWSEKSGPIFALNFAILLSGVCSQSNPAPVCEVPSLHDLLPRDECPIATTSSAPRLWSPNRVHELKEASLEQTLAQVRSNNESFMAVLYHASWCPFSKQMQPLFQSLSTLFPTILHAKVEESSIRPGLLSKHGVYSFPVLYLHIGNSKVRYSGTRSVEDISKFYHNLTGIQPLHTKGVTLKNSEASPKLQTDTYLALATWFLVFRALLYVLPIAVTRIRNFWNRCHLYKMFKPRGPANEVHAGDRRSVDRKRLVRVLSHQIASPSSSLAIAESSTRRVATSEDLVR